MSEKVSEKVGKIKNGKKKVFPALRAAQWDWLLENRDRCYDHNFLLFLTG
jgi:hypothetical protein